MKTTAQKIRLLGNDYPIRFGMRFQRLFMDYFDLELISDYQKHIEMLTVMNSKTSYKVLAVFILSAINAASKKPVDLDLDDILDAVIEDPSIIENMNKVFESSQSKIPKSEARNAVGKQKK